MRSYREEHSGVYGVREYSPRAFLRGARSAARPTRKSLCMLAVAVALLCGGVLSPVQAQEMSPQEAALRTRVETLSKTDAAAAVDLLNTYIDANTLRSENVWFYLEAANLKADKLSDTPGALKVIERAFSFARPVAEQSPNWPLVHLLATRGRILNGSARYAEAAKSFEAEWPRALAARNEGEIGLLIAEAALSQRISAMEQSGEYSQIVSLLNEWMSGQVRYFSGAWQTPDGWMIEHMALSLSHDEKKAGAALSWAKLFYQVSDFKSESVERATRLLSRAWAMGDEFAAATQFAKAQSDAEVANPLRAVKAPGLSVAVQKALSERLALWQSDSAWRTDANKAHEVVGLQIVTRRWQGAMQTALSLLRENPDSPEGAREVARVLKAHDLNTRRANAFLSYLNGQGTNPVMAFQREVQDGEEAGEKESSGAPDKASDAKATTAKPSEVTSEKAK